MTEEKNGKTEVSINESKIQAFAEEIVNGIELNVSVTGLVESTAYGNLTVNTTGTGTPDSASAQSTVSY